MLELLIELFGEFLLQFFVEAILELGMHSLAERICRQPNAWLAAIGYTIVGAMLGAASLYVLPENLVPARWRIVNLVVTPLAVGFLMAAIGVLRGRRGEPLLRIDRFSYGFLFALSLALVRFIFAK